MLDTLPRQDLPPATRRTALAAFTAIAAASLLAACGGSDGDNHAGATATLAVLETTGNLSKPIRSLVDRECVLHPLP
ncbi:hypothetical protein AVHY2522_24130 [Acidovorax sp. SUPP2522]|uniref:hypothetical protein n=1 Tax=unclassified Acidovorax TaxID=2684926 RepID=UPI0023495234|nr:MULTISPECIES: hypothetical protein [unclassified Acidovorax]WCM96744.1 hypothetical protein M5C96_20345 [Acidovorax sp. GBBC 1281]GKT19893.1 hypothetical protein AVHY2522_24130 [Acidovorax sp. SUPP2522]